MHIQEVCIIRMYVLCVVPRARGQVNLLEVLLRRPIPNSFAVRVRQIAIITVCVTAADKIARRLSA